MKKTPTKEKDISNLFLTLEKDFSKRFHTLIDGESIRGFSRRCGFSDGLAHAYLKGEKIPGLAHALAIARAAGVSLDWLTTGKEYVPSPLSMRFPADAPKSPAACETPSLLTEEESALLTLYRAMPPSDQRRAVAILKALNPT